MQRPKPHQQAVWSIHGNSYGFAPTGPSKWELFLEAENISEQDLKNNPKVENFARKHADKYYVPTKVLKMYGIDVFV